MAVKTKEGKIIPDEFFAESGQTDLYGIPLVLPNPTREERTEIRLLKTIYRGVMFVTGKPGQGKDLFIVSLAYLMKRYFGRRVMFDFKPYKLFGEYAYFDPRIMMQEINKMAKLAGIGEADIEASVKEKKEKQEKLFVEAANDWIDKNEVLFNGALVYFSELRRYCYNRNSQNGVNKFIGALNTQWRKRDMLIIGAHIQQHEIDQYTFLENVNHWVRCNWNAFRSNTTSVRIERGVYQNESGVFNALLEDVIFDVNGGKPRTYLTGPDTIFTITPLGMKEAGKSDILAYLEQNGPSPASAIAEQLKIRLEMALKELYVLSVAGLVIGNRFFDLYPTKNFVNLKPALRREI